MNIILPAKSFKSSLNDELVEKRMIELNRYLQVKNGSFLLLLINFSDEIKKKNICFKCKILTNTDMFNKFPGLLDLMLKFLENKRWESQSTFKKKVKKNFLSSYKK